MGANASIGLYQALVTLLHLLEMLAAKRCFAETDSMTVNVDIANLAAVVSAVETPRALKASLQFSNIVKQGANVTVVMTHQSWDAVVNNMGLDRTTEMIERVVHQQGSLDNNVSHIADLVGSCHDTIRTLAGVEAI